MEPSPLHPVTGGRTGPTYATVRSSATPLRKAPLCSPAAGLERSFGWLVHWGGLLRDGAGLDISAAHRVRRRPARREALLNPMPTQAAAS